MEKLQSKFKSKKRSIPYVFLSHFLLAIQIFGQAQSFELYPEYQEVQQFRKNSNFKEAVIALDTLIGIADQKNDENTKMRFKIDKASILRTTGSYYSALEILEPIYSDIKNKTQQFDFNTVILYYELGSTCIYIGDLDRGKRLLENCKIIIQNSKIDNDSLLALCYNRLGTYYYFNRSYDSALINYKIAYDIHISKLNNPSTELSIFLNNLGLGYSQMADFEKAEFYFTQAIENINRLTPKDELLLIKASINFGKLYYDLSSYDKSLLYYNQAEKLLNNLSLSMEIDMGQLAWNKSLLYRSMGDFNKAKYYMDKAIQIINKKVVKESPIISALTMDQALIYELTGLTDEAIKLYRLSLKNAALPVKIKTYRNLGILYYDQNQLKEAGLYFDTCYALIKQLANPKLLIRIFITVITLLRSMIPGPCCI